MKMFLFAGLEMFPFCFLTETEKLSFPKFVGKDEGRELMTWTRFYMFLIIRRRCDVSD